VEDNDGNLKCGDFVSKNHRLSYHLNMSRKVYNIDIQGGPKVTTHTQPFNNSRNLDQNWYFLLVAIKTILSVVLLTRVHKWMESVKNWKR